MASIQGVIRLFICSRVNPIAIICWPSVRQVYYQKFLSGLPTIKQEKFPWTASDFDIITKLLPVECTNQGDEIIWQHKNLHFEKLSEEWRSFVRILTQRFIHQYKGVYLSGVSVQLFTPYSDFWKLTVQ